MLIPIAYQPPKLSSTPASDILPLKTHPSTSTSPSSTMDTQHTTHGSSYAYSTSTYPDFYDAWVEAMFATSTTTTTTAAPGPSPNKNEDIPIFASIIRAQHASATATRRDKVTVIDIGTGTGRVVCELYRELLSPTRKSIGPAAAAHEPQIYIWGIDHSEAMLETAKENFDGSCSGYLAPAPWWLKASAAGFVTALEGEPGDGRLVEGEIDVVMLSAGTIHHLVEPAEVLAFLKELSRGLRPGMGQAVISVLDEMVPSGGEGEGGEEVVSVGVEYGADLVVVSKTRPGTAYVKSPTVTSEESREVELETGDGNMKVKSRVRTDRWRVEMFGGLPEKWQTDGRTPADMVAESQGKKEWTKELEWSVAVWDEDVFRVLASIAGLEIIDMKKGGFQRWYILRKL